jgi:hypothetical protein
MVQAFEMLPSTIDDDLAACRKASMGLVDFWIGYWVIGQMTKKVPIYWKGLPYRTRLELREFADKVERLRKTIDDLSFPKRLHLFVKSPWGMLEVGILMRRYADLRSAIWRVAADEDARGLDVIDRYEKASLAPVSGDYVTLTAEQIRSRAW